jgi:hypothetical protein
MAQENKKKLFYGASKRSLEELLSVAEDQINNEENDENMQKEMLDFLSAFQESSKTSDIYFEDKGIIYSLSENMILINKMKRLN